jgi:inorganic triphosphatase YgiF
MATDEQEQTETERKYDVDAGFVVPDLAGSGGVDSMGPPDVQHLAATYYDTDDLRLIGSRITLRRRTGGDDAGWHIKLPVGGDTRRELHFPLDLPGHPVPEEIAARVAPWSAGGPLRPVARLETRRTVHRLLDQAGQVLAELADDQVTGSRPAPADPDRWRQQDAWREVEVELKSGTPEVLDAAAAGLAAAGARPSRSASKLARVLGTG